MFDFLGTPQNFSTTLIFIFSKANVAFFFKIWRYENKCFINDLKVCEHSQKLNQTFAENFSCLSHEEPKNLARFLIRKRKLFLWCVTIFLYGYLKGNKLVHVQNDMRILCQVIMYIKLCESLNYVYPSNFASLKVVFLTNHSPRTTI